MKRFFLILCAVSIVITSLPFFTYAEEDIFAEYILWIQSELGLHPTPVHENSSYHLYLTDTNTHSITFKSIQYKKKPQSEYSTLSFDIRIIYDRVSETVSVYDTYNQSIQNVNMDFQWYSITPFSFQANNHTYFSCNVGATCETRFSTSSADRGIGSTVRFQRNSNATAGTDVYIYIQNVHSGYQISFLSDLLDSWLQMIYDQAYGAVVRLGDLCNEFFDLPKWTVSENAYDDKGDFIEGAEYSTSWTDAIYQLLKNIYEPFHNQAIQDQRAKDAGALDALDDAYDAAEDAGSFWDLIPFISFSGFGDYDDDAAEDLGTDSISDWFSSTNASWLDQVPKFRSEDDDFVSFYETNISEIQNMLGADTVNSIRGSP